MDATKLFQWNVVGDYEVSFIIIVAISHQGQTHNSNYMLSKCLEQNQEYSDSSNSFM